MTTPFVVDPDFQGGDALAAMAGHVIGPLLGGVAGDDLVLDASGTGSIALPTRSALLVVALRADLAGVGCSVDVALGGRPPTRLVFAPHSPRGAALAVGVPASTTATDVSIKIGSAGAGGIIKARYLDGVLARLLYVFGAEKTRIRTAARAVAAGRLLANASGEALDRLGQELGVARFSAALAWDPTAHQLAATSATELDEAYRARLQIYRPLLRPNRPNLDSALAAEAGGLLARSGYRGHLTVAESDTDLAVAIRIVSPPDDSKRLAYLAYLRANFLLPLDATELPATRPVSPGERSRARTLLARLKTEAKWPSGAYVATPLAVAVDRAARCLAALGVTTTITITGAQNDAGGSRYELGLGIDVTRFDTATLTSLVTAATAGKVTDTTSADVRALVAKLAPQPAADDPHARWLWSACGMRTVHPLATGSTFLSTLPMHGAQLMTSPLTGALQVDATLNAPGDPAIAQNAQLASTIATAAAAAPPGAKPWTVVGAAQTQASLVGAAPAPAAAIAVFQAQQLPMPSTAAAVATTVAALQNVPSDLWVGLSLDPTTAAALLAGQPAGAASLAEIVGRLKRAGAVSVLPMVAGTTVYLLLGVVDLPGAATLDNRRLQWRWLALPLGEDTRIGSLDEVTSGHSRYTYASSTSTSQLAVIVAVTPTRVDPVDLAKRIEPYTVAIDAPGQPPLSFAQYEYLMNMLDRYCPLGITIDTSRIRAAHVDLDGDNVPDLLDQGLQHTFRPFQGPRRFSTRT